MLTDAQKSAREGSLGSSDAPVVCDVSPYKSPQVLFYQLHGELERYSEDETEAQEFSFLMEPVLAQIFTKRTGLKVRRSPPRRHSQYPFMTANLDYEIVGDARGPGVLELKMRDRSQLPLWEHGIPDDIHLQVAHQLAVTNREWARVTVGFGNQCVRIYEVERDKELEAYLIEIERRFMVLVEKGEPPGADWSRDGLDVLKKLYPQDSGKTITLDDPQAVAMIEQYLGTKEALTDTQQKHDAAKGWLQSAMQDASTALVPGYAITWKTTKPTNRFDEDAFHAAHPDLYRQFMRERPGYRRFLLKPAKEIV